MAQRILVVEDDQLLRELYVDTLKSEGYEVDSSEDGESGYQKMKQGGWDLILLDIILPKISGLDIMKKLSEESNTSYNKTVVFLTNLDKSEEIKEALKLGRGYLIKSQMTPGDLVNEVHMYLSKQQ